MLRPPRQAGFTIVELVMVMIMIGVLGAVAAMRWSNNTDPGPTALLLAEDIRLTQSLSMNRGAGTFLIQRTDANHYQILRNTTPYFSPARETGVPIGDFALRFSAMGTPEDAAGNTLTQDTTITVGSSVTSTITVRQETGLTEVAP